MHSSHMVDITVEEEVVDVIYHSSRLATLKDNCFLEAIQGILSIKEVSRCFLHRLTGNDHVFNRSSSLG